MILVIINLTDPQRIISPFSESTMATPHNEMPVGMAEPVNDVQVLTLEPIEDPESPRSSPDLGGIRWATPSPEFERDEFRENICRQDGRETLRITAKNRNKMKNIKFLRKRHGEGWGTETGITYTPEMTGCVPTKDEILSLRLEKFEFRGIIVCEDGGVYNADMERELVDAIVNGDFAYT